MHGLHRFLLGLCKGGKSGFVESFFWWGGICLLLPLKNPWLPWFRYFSWFWGETGGSLLWGICRGFPSCLSFPLFPFVYHCWGRLLNKNSQNVCIGLGRKLAIEWSNLSGKQCLSAHADPFGNLPLQIVLVAMWSSWLWDGPVRNWPDHSEIGLLIVFFFGNGLEWF